MQGQLGIGEKTTVGEESPRSFHQSLLWRLEHPCIQRALPLTGSLRHLPCLASLHLAPSPPSGLCPMSPSQGCRISLTLLPLLCPALFFLGFLCGLPSLEHQCMPPKQCENGE